MSIIDTLLATVGPHNTVLHAHSLKRPRFIQEALHDPNEDACKIKSKRVDHTFKMVDNKPRHNRVYRTVRKPTETTDFSDKQTSIRPPRFIGYTDNDKYQWTLMATEQQLAQVPPEQYFGCRFVYTHLNIANHIGFIISLDENLVYSANYIDKLGNYYVSTNIKPFKIGSDKFKAVFGDLSKRDIFINKSKYKPVQKDKIIPTNIPGDEIRRQELNNELGDLVHRIRTHYTPMSAENKNQQEDFAPMLNNNKNREQMMYFYDRKAMEDPDDPYHEPDYEHEQDPMASEYPDVHFYDPPPGSNKLIQGPQEPPKQEAQSKALTGDEEHKDNKLRIQLFNKNTDIDKMNDIETENENYMNIQSSRIMGIREFNKLSDGERRDKIRDYLCVPAKYINNVFYAYIENSKHAINHYYDDTDILINKHDEAQEEFEYFLDNEFADILEKSDNYSYIINPLYTMYDDKFGEIINIIGERCIFKDKRKKKNISTVIRKNINDYVKNLASLVKKYYKQY